MHPVESVIPFLVSAIFSGFVVFFRENLGMLTSGRNDLHCVQTSHAMPTPRVGGAGIFLALLTGLSFLPLTSTEGYQKFIYAGAVLFLVGLAEDLGWHMSARRRLFAATVSSVLVVVGLDLWVTRLGAPFVDNLMLSGWLGIPLTVFAVVAISHAFNLIDGVNGLSGITALIGAAALSITAISVGQIELALIAIFVALALFGFLVFNFPFGRIFLGDAGAYTLGFTLSWIGVALVERSGTINPWAILLMLFWPIADTIMTIARRIAARKPAMEPDRLHVHQIVMRMLESRWIGRRRQVSNPLTTVILLPLVIFPAAIGIALRDQAILAFFAFVALVVLYFWLYGALCAVFRKRRGVSQLRTQGY